MKICENNEEMGKNILNEHKGRKFKQNFRELTPTLYKINKNLYVMTKFVYLLNKFGFTFLYP
jgi:hypothetical protein